MRLLMGIIQDRHHTYYARKKVPKNLESAVAKITGAGRQSLKCDIPASTFTNEIALSCYRLSYSGWPRCIGGG